MADPASYRDTRPVIEVAMPGTVMLRADPAWYRDRRPQGRPSSAPDAGVARPWHSG